MGGGAISWSSRAQTTAAEGTSDAEYVTISKIVKEVLFLRQVQTFVMPAFENDSSDFVEGNRGVIKMVKNRHSSKRTRHIDTKHQLIRDAVDDGKNHVIYVNAEDQHVDVVTKPLDWSVFEKHMNAPTNVG